MRYFTHNTSVWALEHFIRCESSVTLDMKIKRGVTNGNIHNRPTGLQ